MVEEVVVCEAENLQEKGNGQRGDTDSERRKERRDGMWEEEREKEGKKRRCWGEDKGDTDGGEGWWRKRRRKGQERSDAEEVEGVGRAGDGRGDGRRKGVGRTRSGARRR